MRERRIAFDLLEGRNETLRRRTAAAIAAAGAITLAAVVFVVSLPRTLPDGQAELASKDRVGHERLAVDTKGQNPGATWSYGIRLCLAGGEKPIAITGLAPAQSIGNGYTFVGASIRTFQPSPSHTVIIGVQPYPPPASVVPDPLVPAVGATVSTACSNGPTEPYTELIIGLQLVGDDGGGWQGVDITYRSVSGAHTVEIGNDLFICGKSVQVYCTDPQGSG